MSKESSIKVETAMKSKVDASSRLIDINNYDWLSATKHMTLRWDWFVYITPIDNKVTVANGTKVDAEGISKISLNTENNGNTFNDVMYFMYLSC